MTDVKAPVIRLACGDARWFTSGFVFNEQVASILSLEVSLDLHLPVLEYVTEGFLGHLPDR